MSKASIRRVPVPTPPRGATGHPAKMPTTTTTVLCLLSRGLVRNWTRLSAVSSDLQTEREYLAALAIEARMFRLTDIPRVALKDPGHRRSDKGARRTWTFVYTLGVICTAGVMVWSERLTLIALAKGDHAQENAQAGFGTLVFGLVAVLAAGIMLPRGETS